jgi:hypothetical protein
VPEGAKNLQTRVKLPTLVDLDPSVDAPLFRVRILRAKAGGWDVAAEGPGDLDFTPKDKGAYRAEVRITPKHLRRYLSSYASLADREVPWVYGNAIYVTD